VGEPTVETVGSNPCMRTLGAGMGRGPRERFPRLETSGSQGEASPRLSTSGHGGPGRWPDWVSGRAPPCLGEKFMFSTSDHRFLGRSARGAWGDGLGPGGWLGGHCPGHASVAAAPPETGRGCARLQSWSRRDAGLVGASLSADAPLVDTVAQVFSSCQVRFRTNFRLGDPPGAGCGHGGLSACGRSQDRDVLRYDRRGCWRVPCMGRTAGISPRIPARSGRAG
jgi:hypothetical protein